MKKNPIKILLVIIIFCFAAASLFMFASVLADFVRVSNPVGVITSVSPSPSAAPVPASVPSPSPTPEPIPEDVQLLMRFIPQTAAEMAERSGMFARFVIPDDEINVALFTDGPGETVAEKRQAMCDAEDSAALYYDDEGAVIADHNNQGFANLINVQVGHRAYFITADSVVLLECTAVIDGHNNDHKGIVDENYQPIHNAGDYICYTCKDNWLNVRIAVLDVIGEYSV